MADQFIVNGKIQRVRNYFKPDLASILDKTMLFFLFNLPRRLLLIIVFILFAVAVIATFCAFIVVGLYQEPFDFFRELKMQIQHSIPLGFVGKVAFALPFSLTVLVLLAVSR